MPGTDPIQVLVSRSTPELPCTATAVNWISLYFMKSLWFGPELTVPEKPESASRVMDMPSVPTAEICTVAGPVEVLTRIRLPTLTRT